MSKNSESCSLRLKEIQLRIDYRLILDISEIGIDEGRMTLLTGANGSGKTTLLRVMAGLEKPCSGSVLFKGEEINFGKQGLNYRRRVSMLAQEPYLFQGSVIDNVMYGPISHGLSRDDAEQKAFEALDSTGCTHLAEKRTRGLSGGEKKRIALACLLTLDTELMLLDEPTAQVDKENSLIIRDLIHQQLDFGKTIVFSTHQSEWAQGFKCNTFHIEYGKLLSDSR